jgi:hypothetical protein
MNFGLDFCVVELSFIDGGTIARIGWEGTEVAVTVSRARP